MFNTAINFRQKSFLKRRISEFVRKKKRLKATCEDLVESFTNGRIERAIILKFDGSEGEPDL